MSEAKFLTREETRQLFAKLTLAYGTKFRERWQDVPWEAVMADWAERLGEFTGDAEAIACALRNINPSFPPTAMEFGALCQQAVMARDAERERQERLQHERALTPEGMEWVWERVRYEGAPPLCAPTRRPVLRAIGSGLPRAPAPQRMRVAGARPLAAIVSEALPARGAA